MKNKRLAAMVLSSTMILSFAMPAYAADTATSNTEASETTDEAADKEQEGKDATSDADLIVDPDGTKGDNSLLEPGKLEEVKAKTGSISVKLTDEKTGTSKENVEISCLKVADVKGGEYVLDEVYSSLGVDLNNLQNAGDLEKAATTLANKSGNGTLLKSDSNGNVSFGDLEVGVYLLTATKTTSYDDVTPVLISIPTWDETQGEMIYDVSVTPKHTPKPDSTKTTKNAPQTNVNSPVGLYLGGAAVAAATLVGVNVVSKKKKAD